MIKSNIKIGYKGVDMSRMLITFIKNIYSQTRLLVSVKNNFRKFIKCNV